MAGEGLNPCLSVSGMVCLEEMVGEREDRKGGREQDVEILQW